MVELFKLAGPSVILLDKLTMYARQLDDERFEAFLSFVQSLTCEQLRRACENREALGEQGEGNCRRYRQRCRDVDDDDED